MDLDKILEWVPWLVPNDATSVRFTPQASDGRGLGEAPSAERVFTYLDCGAWMGDGDRMPAQRDFALVCGRTTVLCDFLGEARFEPVTQGCERENGALNRALAALAGPQGMDVTVHRALRAPGPEPEEPNPRVFLLLPDAHLPVLATLPEVDPNLIPDPALATCTCHGPIVMRILGGGRGDAPAQYRAVGTVSRNPNDWIYMMAESYENAARDLSRLLDRVTKHAARVSFHTVQLGDAFDVWRGFECVVQSAGRMAWLIPDIVADVSEEDLLGSWVAATHDTRVRDAVLKLHRIPRARRTFLAAHEEPGVAQASSRAVFEEAGIFAEHGPRDLPAHLSREDRPSAFLALLEQRAQSRPWNRAFSPGFRVHMVASATRRWLERPFSVYAMAHSLRPCLVNVVLGPSPRDGAASRATGER